MLNIINIYKPHAAPQKRWFQLFIFDDIDCNCGSYNENVSWNANNSMPLQHNRWKSNNIQIQAKWNEVSFDVTSLLILVKLLKLIESNLYRTELRANKTMNIDECATISKVFWIIYRAKHHISNYTAQPQ